MVKRAERTRNPAQAACYDSILVREAFPGVSNVARISNLAPRRLEFKTERMSVLSAQMVSFRLTMSLGPAQRAVILDGMSNGGKSVHHRGAGDSEPGAGLDLQGNCLNVSGCCQPDVGGLRANSPGEIDQRISCRGLPASSATGDVCHTEPVSFAQRLKNTNGHAFPLRGNGGGASQCDGSRHVSRLRTTVSKSLIQMLRRGATAAQVKFEVSRNRVTV